MLHLHRHMAAVTQDLHARQLVTALLGVLDLHLGAEIHMSYC